MKKILITGGAGFIGSHVVRSFVKQYSDYQIYKLNLLTYVCNLANLRNIEKFSNYHFIKGDVTDEIFITKLFQKHQFDAVIHLSAESYVDRFVLDPLFFIKTNVIGIVILLQAFKNFWQLDWSGKLFYNISTDEVYVSLDEIGLFTKSTSYNPNSPYSVSKTSSEHFIRAYEETYGSPYVIGNCSNNYSLFQFPKKLIFIRIKNILDKKSLSICGDGKFTRDCFHSEDYARLLESSLCKERVKSIYRLVA